MRRHVLAEVSEAEENHRKSLSAPVDASFIVKDGVDITGIVFIIF